MHSYIQISFLLHLYEYALRYFSLCVCFPGHFAVPQPVRHYARATAQTKKGILHNITVRLADAFIHSALRQRNTVKPQ